MNTSAKHFGLAIGP